MNTATIYKGFTINTQDGRFFVFDGLNAASAFNPDGYATLNNAKGAITKHLSATASQESAFVQSVINTPTQPADKLEEFRESHRNEDTVVVASGDGISAVLEALSVPTGAYLPREMAQGDGYKASHPVSRPDGPNFLFGVYDAYGDPIAGNPKWAAIYAGMRYMGMLKESDKRSRNKREGRYAGKTVTSHHYRSHRAAMPGRDAFGRKAS